MQQNQPLIGIELKKNGKVIYFTDEKEADKIIPKSSTKLALSLAGAWKKIDWKKVKVGLEKIRHQTSPSKLLSL